MGSSPIGGLTPPTPPPGKVGPQPPPPQPADEESEYMTGFKHEMDFSIDQPIKHPKEGVDKP